MIGFLSGKVIAAWSNQIIVRVPAGIGYIVSVSPKSNFLLNENVEIFILTVYKDNDTELFAFDTLSEREWVEKLRKVDGVGPKTAATIVYSLGVADLAQAVATGDSTTLSSVKGLGIKTTKKIILELKGGDVDLDSLDTSSRVSQVSANFTDALISLGYKRGEVVSTITQLKKDGLWQEEDLSTLVKAALKYLAKR